jgi:uncharacterized protein (TIGR03066 family)
MNVLRVLLIAFTEAALGIAAAADEKKPDKSSDNEKLLVGTWEASKTDEDTGVTLGDVADFSKDGKLKVNHKKKDGNEEIREATYKLEGDKLTVMLTKDGSGSGRMEITIKKLTDTECVMVGEGGKTVEWKRKKGS